MKEVIVNGQHVLHRIIRKVVFTLRDIMVLQRQYTTLPDYMGPDTQYPLSLSFKSSDFRISVVVLGKPTCLELDRKSLRYDPF